MGKYDAVEIIGRSGIVIPECDESGVSYEIGLVDVQQLQSVMV